MKKLVLIISLFLILPNVYALNEKLIIEEKSVIEEDNLSTEINPYIAGEYEVSLVNCINSEEMMILYNGKKTRIKLLALDSGNGSLNKEIKSYVCDLLNNSDDIKIEIDPSFDFLDEYNRLNVWLYVDGELLQNTLIKKGYGQVNYIKGDYKYIDDLCSTQYNAIKNKLGIWNYDDIKEEYCDSNIKIAKNKEKIKEKNEKNNQKTIKLLRYLVYLSSGIIILLIALRKNVYEKKR